MKYIYLFLVLLGLAVPSKAQTITAPAFSWGWTLNSATSYVGISFLVKNNNTFPVMLTGVGVVPWYIKPHELWYSSTSITGATGSITPSNWTQISSITPTTTSGTIVNNFYPNLRLIIPAGAIYRFAHTVENAGAGVGVLYMGAQGGTFPPPPYTLTPATSGGVSLDVNGSFYGTTAAGLTGTDFGFVGSITFNPCASMPIILPPTNIRSTSANISWNAVLGSVGYDYAVTTSATPPTSGFIATTATSATVTGLTPATNYIIWVRNKCSSTSFSEWERLRFETQPTCSKPIITIKDVKETSAKISWKVENHALNYEYVLDQNSADPTVAGAPSTGTENPTGLLEATKYYVHVKMNCKSGETSGWALDSFTTSFTCRPPVLTADYEHVDRAMVYWKPVLGAVAYEYEISQSPTPLGHGTDIKTTNFLAYPLKDGQVYYFHVRTSCDDRGFKSKSEWTTTSFRTFPTSVNNISGKDLGITVYPNPVKNILTVRNDGRNPEGTVILMDISGKIIYTSNLDSKTLDIDMSSYADGVYLLKYMSSDGGNQIIRVTKQ